MMEKIQSAIAKARAARENGAPPQTVAQPVRPAAPAPLRPERYVAPPETPVVEATKSMLSTDDVMANWIKLRMLEPNVKQLQQRRIVTLQGGKEAVTFDVMRTKLLQQMRANNWRRLAITSPTAGCGKSTTCMNLAFSLARQPEVRTVVAEVDLRRPSLASTMNIRPEVSFADVLLGSQPFDKNAIRVGSNLCIAANQHSARNPSELLQNMNVPSALAEIEARFEPTIMIFDMPPMLVSDDAMAFIGQVDCVLLVAAAEASTIQEVDVCERDLASQTNVLGVILNKCRYMDRNYGYSYYG